MGKCPFFSLPGASCATCDPRAAFKDTVHITIITYRYVMPLTTCRSTVAGRQPGTTAISWLLLYFPIRAGCTCSSSAQQLAGLVGAAPALTGRPVFMIWRPKALLMVPRHPVVQEDLLSLKIHSVTRARRLERKPADNPRSFHRTLQMPHLCIFPAYGSTPTHSMP